MEKINFKNKGETDAVSINAENLNLLQTNVENEIETNINNLLNTLCENPVGEFLLWEGNVLIDSPPSGTWEKLTTFYWLKSRLEMLYPLKAGFTRTAKLCMEYSDDKSTGNVYVKFEDSDYSKQYIFGRLNGNSGETYNTLAFEEFDYDGLTIGHKDISVTPDWASGGKVRIYRLYLLIYDKPN